jgi:hypothetical protein
MPSLNLESFGDLVETTITEYIKTDYVSLLTDLTDHPAAKSLLRKNRMEPKASPTGADWKVRIGTAESYRHIHPTTPDSAEITDDFISASVPWRKTETKYAFLEEHIDFNMGPNQILDLVKAKEHGCDFDFIEGLERDFWKFTLVSDTNGFRSLPYWVTKNATEGFNGGIPTGYSDVAGISPTTYARWNNYTAQYTDVALDDMILKARTMATKTGFKPPVDGVPDLGDTGKAPRQYYTNLDVQQKFANVADSRNDNLGPDVAKHDGIVTFRNAAINYVPVLDEDTTDPFYQINWNVFKMMVRKKWFQKRTVLKPYPGQRNQVAVFKDTYSNFACFNRRLCGVLATGTTYPS